MKLVDLTGKKFERLTVICRKGYLPNGINRAKAWLCICSCGQQITVAGNLLSSGGVKSCGCLRTERLIARNTTHGKSKHRLYPIWNGIKQRCGIIKGSSKKEKRIYHSNGIKMCKEWDNFNGFLEWAIKAGWRKGFCIDRKDTNGNYTPANCRFTTSTINNQNSRLSKRWFIDGIKYNSSYDAAKAIGVSATTICRWCKGNKKNCYSVNIY